MTEFIENIFAKLREFDLDDNEINVYITLLQNGPLTFLQISRKSEIHRTTVYRAVERLEKKKLAKTLVNSKKQLVEAADPEIITEILNLEKKVVLRREKILPDLLTDLTTILKIESPKTQVKYYKGVAGIRQLLWSSTKRENQTLLGYGYKNWTPLLGYDFAEDLRKRHVDNRITHYELNNTKFAGGAWTNILEFVNKYYHARYIDPKIVEVHHDLLIFEDRVVFDTDYDGDIFGIEIINSEIARTQSQLYWLAWEKGVDMKPFGEEGKVVES
jgi:DNA-binding Lrp family transcriptional regulator/uncharacterized protein YuzE